MQTNDSLRTDNPAHPNREAVGMSVVKGVGFGLRVWF